MKLRPSDAGGNGVATAYVRNLLTSCAISRVEDYLVTTRMHFLLAAMLSVARHELTLPMRNVVKESQNGVAQVLCVII